MAVQLKRRAVWHVPASLNLQGVVTGSGGLATAPNPALGQPSPQRWALDRASFRAYDGTSNNYGAPSGAGVSVEITADGRLFLGGQAANLVIDDANGVPRVELGPMPARGVSPAQTGLRVNDGNANPIFDTLGLIGVMTLLGSVTNVSQSSVTGNGSWQAVSGSTVSFSLARQTAVLVLGAATVVDPTVGDSGFNLEGTVLVDGAQSNSNGPVFAPGTASFTMTPFAVLPTLSASSHTVSLGVNQTSTHLWTVIGGYVYVFQLGA